ncbi:MAG: hypothetical protein EBW51_06055, partial [Actinobacteria bacterium]|nr:hypothetical protein [Actinomycetota bacterium]
MAINFPGSLDNFTNPTSASPINSPSHADQHANANDAIEALEAKVGVDGSSVVTSHDYKIAQLQSLVTSAVAGAKSIYQDVRNQSGSAFTKATPVYVSGSTGASGQLLVSAASNATEATSSKTMGITTSAISNNSNGQVISEGILEGIDTTGAADGDPVWLGVNGAKIYGLANKPSAPAHLVFLGIVIRGGQANTGSMYVKIQNGFELHELHNVEVSSLVNGNILAYDSTTQTWKNTNTLQSTSSTTPLVVKGTSSPSVNIFEVQNSGGYPMVFVDAYGALKAQASGMYVNSGYASGTGLVVRGYTSQTADLQQWQNSSGSVLAAIKPSGQLKIQNIIDLSDGGPTIQFGSSAINIWTFSASAIPLIINAFTGQSNDLTQWKDSSGNKQVWINSAGVFNALSVVGTYNSYFYAGSSGAVPIKVIGAVNQTGNLQEWQNSSGTALGWFNAYGSMQITNSFNGARAELGNTGVAQASTLVLKIQGVSGQTANLTEWQTNTGAVVAYVDPNGSAYFNSNFQINGVAAIGGSPQAYSQLIIQINSTTRNGLIIKGASGQTANLQEWQNSAGTALASVSATGTIYAYETANSDALNIYQGSGARRLVFGLGGLSTTSTFTSGSISWSGVAQTEINSGTASRVGLLVKGAASQTANLQEWQNSAGTVLTRIKSNGNLIINADGFSAVENTTPAVKINSNTAQNAAEEVLLRFHRSGVGSTTYGGGVDFKVSQWQSTSAGSGYIPYTQLTIALKSGATDNESANINVLTLRDNSTVGINNTTPSAQLDINIGLSSRTGLIVKAAASQTADLQQWQDTSGTVLGSVVQTDSNNMVLRLPQIQGKSGGYPWISFGSSITNTANQATDKPLVVKGASSQSANLTEWQNSAGTVLSNINSSGLNEWRDSTGTYRFGLKYSADRNIIDINSTNSGLVFGWSPNYIGGYGTDAGAGNTWWFSPFTGTRVGVIIRGKDPQTADLQQWQNNSGTVLASVSSAGGFGVPAIGNPGSVGPYQSFNSTDITITSRAAANIGLIIKGAASQTADLQQWQTSTGSINGKVDNNGTFWIGTANLINYGYSTFAGNNAGNVPIIIIGAPSQTADLQQWKNSAGTVLSKIASNGRMVISSDTEVSSGMLTISQAATSAIVLSTTSTANDYGLALNATGSGNNTSIGISFSAFASNGYNGVATPGGAIWFTRSGSYSLGYLSFLTRSGVGANDPLTERMRIGDTGTVSISGFTASSQGLIIKAAASQTADLQQWQNSSGNIVSSIRSNGGISLNYANTIRLYNTANTDYASLWM